MYSTESEKKEPSVVRQELETVRSTLAGEESLSGQQVMVPMTTKAFFAGTLKPTLKDGQEQVLVKMVDSNLVELDRSQAVNHLDRRIQSLSSTSTTVANETTSAPAGESSNEEAPALPFFEIREELDESGREVKAEAINVAKQLEFLQKKEGKTTNASTIVPSASDEMIQDDPEQLKPVTDAEYDALSKRLDMLARLEEEAEKVKEENQTSAKKLQSKGWSKGFLNAKPKKKRTPAKSTETLPTTTTTTASMSTSTQGKRVGFQAANEVREIPRVGERSASELKPAVASRKEIEPQVFSGVIRERSVGSAAADSPSSRAPAKKKLSRFVQERQEQQR